MGFYEDKAHTVAFSAMTILETWTMNFIVTAVLPESRQRVVFTISIGLSPTIYWSCGPI